MMGGCKVPWPLHRTASRGAAWSAPRVTVYDRQVVGECLSPQSDLRPTDECVATGFVAKGDECAAATPRRGPTDGVICCVLDKCVGGSKDARAVRPYSVCGVFCRERGGLRVLSREAMSARRPRQGEALPPM
jgi:hypothetical protein